MASEVDVRSPRAGAAAIAAHSADTSLDQIPIVKKKVGRNEAQFLRKKKRRPDNAAREMIEGK